MRTWAAYSKELLKVIPATKVTSMPSTVGIGSIQGDAKVNRSIRGSKFNARYCTTTNLIPALPTTYSSQIIPTNPCHLRRTLTTWAESLLDRSASTNARRLLRRRICYNCRKGKLFPYERSALLFLLLDDIICESVGWPRRRQ